MLGIGQVMSETVVIHLDVNGTIMAADPVQGKTSEIAVTHELAKKTTGIWRDDLPEMRYQDYVEQHLIPGAEADQSIKHKRRQLYLEFLPMLQKQQHPVLQATQAKYDDLMAALKNQEGPLYASFWKLVAWAQTSAYDVRLVFRTFGQDIPDIIHLLAEKGYPLTNVLGFQKGRLYRGKFKGHDFVKGEPCEEISAIYADPFNAVKDDWQWWNSHGEIESHAKPFPYLPQVTSIFFDDNAKAKQIVAPHGFIGSYDQQLTTADLLKSGHVVAVNSLKAMVDPNYFIDRVKTVLSTKR
ncbi:hypothetical protein ID47_09120 [Candidatus Paracaedibacter acanthamoebae]|uniref:Uncharacterized protein n=2 Tax=Candidatus Odyssella acanthamoebae TaxID=91604 RepID=A0A077AXW7_9PROT|nr:hypothetical protein ID47_09120 [Candidatus Paracaedibacter acanthamoebae]